MQNPPESLLYVPKLQNIINNLLITGIIRESIPSFSSPIILVQKNNELRLYINYCKVSEITISDNYSIQRIDRLNDKMFFIVRDLNDNFIYGTIKDKVLFYVPSNVSLIRTNQKVCDRIMKYLILSLLAKIIRFGKSRNKSNNNIEQYETSNKKYYSSCHIIPKVYKGVIFKIYIIFKTMVLKKLFAMYKGHYELIRRDMPSNIYFRNGQQIARLSSRECLRQRPRQHF